MPRRPRRHRRFKSKPKSQRRVGSLPVLIAAAVLVAGLLYIVAVKRGGPAGREPVATATHEPAAIDSAPPDPVEPIEPLPVRRLLERPGGDAVLDAVDAAGGWDAWSDCEAVTYRFESVVFDERGVIRSTRSARHTFELTLPPRIHVDDSAGNVAGFRPAGAWGSRRRPNGVTEIDTGPGGRDPEALKRYLLTSWWLFRLPFNLGDIEPVLEVPESDDVLDRRVRVLATYPAGPGDSEDRRFLLTFDPGSGHLKEVLFVGARPADLLIDPPAAGDEDGALPSAFGLRMTLDDYRDFEGIVLPTRRSLTLVDPNETVLRNLAEFRLSEVEWNPPVVAGLYDPPGRF